jgi:hypothetical protein
MMLFRVETMHLWIWSVSQGAGHRSKQGGLGGVRLGESLIKGGGSHQFLGKRVRGYSLFDLGERKFRGQK